MRAQAGLEVLLGSGLCDSKRVAAAGYCFGGTTVLELARSGAPIAEVVSFHSGLATPTPGDAKSIRCKVLVLHGGDDPHVPRKDVEAFEDEMRSTGVDWQLNVCGGTAYSFTNPPAGDDNSQGAAYTADPTGVRGRPRSCSSPRSSSESRRNGGTSPQARTGPFRLASIRQMLAHLHPRSPRLVCVAIPDMATWARGGPCAGRSWCG